MVVLLYYADMPTLALKHFRKPSADEVLQWPKGSVRIGTVSRGEIKFILLLVVAIGSLTSLPYALGWSMSIPYTEFAGVLAHDSDSNNYLAYSHQSASGSWLFHNPMTGEPHRAVFFNLEWLAIGKIAWLFHISLPAATNLTRLVFIGLMSCAVYWLSTFVSQEKFVRQIATAAIMTGGGFGWIAAIHLLHIRLDSSYFLDLSNANLFPFHWELKIPHFLISETFVILALCFLLRGERSRSAYDYVLAGVCFWCAGACRPYDMLFLMTATSLYALWEGIRSARLEPVIFLRSIPVLMSTPLLGYYYWIFKLHPVFNSWSLPGLPAPPPWVLALSFGMSFVFLVAGLWRFNHENWDETTRLVICALFTGIVLAQLHYFLHFAFQFATNILVPMVVLTVIAWRNTLLKLRETTRWGRPLVIGLVAANSLTSLALTGQMVVLVRKGDFRSDIKMLQAYSWLDAHSGTGDLVLADYDNSNLIPRYTHNNVFCGYVNAVNFRDKSQQVRLFLSHDIPDRFRQELLRDNRIRFVLLTSAEERDLTELTRSSFLHQTFRNQAAVIFAVSEGVSDSAGAS